MSRDHSLRWTRPSVWLVLAAAVLAGVSASAQEPPVAQPGPEHKLLQESEGTWDAVVKGGPQESKCVAIMKMTCGGLWLVSEFRGDFGGAPFEGRGLDGYDQDKKKYVGVWVDSMTSGYMTFEGTYDEKTKSLTSYGEGKGPDGNPAKFKAVTKHTDKDHQTFIMSLVGPDGNDIPLMTIEYTRRK